MDNEALLREFDQEMQVTRRVLERVPDGKADWKPHAKSFSLAHLAQLVARMPGWFTQMLRQPSLDLGGAQPYSNESPAALLAEFDRNASQARADIVATAHDGWKAEWSLTNGAQVLLKSTRADMVRQTMNHLVHHRAQLGVYLRLLDVPVPSMYGPTADERW